MSIYHDILGVGPKATDAEIKKAYRKKAFEFHPDRNKSEGAQEKFVEATIAYEYLLYGKLNTSTTNTSSSQGSTTTKSKQQKRPPKDPEEFAAWKKQAQQKAEAQAKVRYEEFKKQNAAFKKTFFYPFALVLTLVVALLCAIISAAFFALPFIILLKTDQWFLGLLSVAYWLVAYGAYNSTLEMVRIFKIHFT